MKNLREASLSGKTVLYRPDYNVPLKGGVIQDPFRITATFETIQFMIDAGAKIVIASHLGRPDGHVMQEFSLRPVAEYIAGAFPNSHVRIATDIMNPDVAKTIGHMHAGDILLLENIRFMPGEEENQPALGDYLSSLADIYVNDAFAACHRAHASIVAPASHLPSYPGFLLEKELENLGNIVGSPERPFVVIMGGAKVSDKITVIKRLGAVADTLLIGGAMANTFLLAQGEPVGDSKVEKEKRHVAEELMHEFGSKLFLPPDFAKEEEGETFRYLDIGPRAIEMFKERLRGAKTVFWNGSLGYTEQAPFDTGSRAIAEFLSELDAHTVVAGGDTVEMLTRLGLHEKIGFVSTGGGAALEFLAGNTLPGVAALEQNQ